MSTATRSTSNETDRVEDVTGPRRLVLLHTPEIERLSYPPDCPFKTGRAAATRDKLASLGLLGGPGQEERAFSKAGVDDLLRIHTPEYLEELQRAAAGHLTVDGLHMGIGGHDTPVFADMFEYGSWACGAGLAGADLLLRREADIVFNLHGGLHHAKASGAGGFCYLNDVALTCLHLAESGRRVACIDIDAHHGDGTQSLLYERPDILKVSIHESGRTLFPWGGFEDEIGAGAGTGFNVNVPLPVETYDAAYLRVFDTVVMQVVRAFKPDVLVVELGMDILAGDPLTHLRLTNNVVFSVLQTLLRLELPIVVAGGGGYNAPNCIRGWALAWSTCLGEVHEDVHLPVIGGGMMSNMDWAGGLRDPERPVLPEERAAADAALGATAEKLWRTFFPLHGLPISR